VYSILGSRFTGRYVKEVPSLALLAPATDGLAGMVRARMLHN
jgi:hypothetical protein